MIFDVFAMFCDVFRCFSTYIREIEHKLTTALERNLLQSEKLIGGKLVNM